MRESALNLDEALQKGLLPVLGTNLKGLQSCKNAKPNGVGMEYIPPYSSYLGLTGTYPFPQLLVGEKYSYIASSSVISECTSGSLVLKYTNNATTQYDLADFKESVVIAGNGIQLYRSPNGLLSPIGCYEYGYIGPIVAGKSCCSFNGLLVLASESTVYWAARPLSIEFNLQVNNVPTGAGFIKPFCGKILRVISTKKQVIVFGTSGISILSFTNDPLPSFGETSTIPCSIGYREAVAHNADDIFFVDLFGFLWQLDVDKGKITKIGFSHIFKNTQPVGSYDSDNNEFLFCNGTQTLVIGQYGVGSREQVITSGGSIDGQHKVIVNSTHSQDLEVVVANQDFGYNGIKTQYAAEINAETDGSIYADEAYTGPSNVGMKIIASETFRPTIKITGHSHALVCGLLLRWKLTDKRYARGRNDNQIAA